MKIVRFKDMSNNDWDAHIYKIPEATFMHTSWYIDYLNAGNKDRGAKSFIVFDGNTPVAVCPLAIFMATKLGKEYTEGTFGGFPSIYPAVAELLPTQRRRLIRKVFSLIDEILVSHNAKK